MKKIIDDLIRKESRKEAIDILEKANDAERKEFLDYYNKESYNVCCLVLDKIKDRLVEDGKMNDNGDFVGFMK